MKAKIISLGNRPFRRIDENSVIFVIRGVTTSQAGVQHWNVGYSTNRNDALKCAKRLNYKIVEAGIPNDACKIVEGAVNLPFDFEDFEIFNNYCIYGVEYHVKTLTAAYNPE
jgi:hypothetical protein